MNHEQLLASLQIYNDDDTSGVYFDSDLNGRYIDWSSSRKTHFATNGENGEEIGRHFEVRGEGDDIALLALDWTEIERLHRALTILLLSR